MALKLIAVDLDGTLLDPNHVISAQNKAAVCRAAAQGVIVTIATGRMYPSARPYAEQIGVDVPIITYNGALIKSVSGEVLFAKYIDPQAVAALMEFCRARNWYIQAYSEDQLYFAAHDQRAKTYEQLAGITGVAVGDALYQMKDAIPKLLIVTESEAQSDEFVEILRRAFGDHVFVTKSNPMYIEIVDRSVNKAAALDILIEKFHLSRAEVMAIGDSNNDVPMLQRAGISVAMGNASKRIQDLCDFVTGDCAHSGVAAAIKKYVPFAFFLFLPYN